MLIWSGWGGITFLIAFIPAWIFDSIIHIYYTNIPIVLGLICSALINDFFTDYIQKYNKDQVLIDEKTNKKVILKDGSSLFFIPIRAWSYIFMALALAFAFMPSHVPGHG
jgi:hypothetical protein